MKQSNMTNSSTQNVRFFHAVTATLVAVVSVHCMLHVWEDLLTIALRDSESSHIFLVPIVCGYLMWFRRDKFKALNGRGNVIGVPLIIAASFLHDYCLNAQIIFGWHLSAIVCLIGGLVLTSGVGVLVQFQPVVFATFLMVPIPGLIRQQLSTPIQLLSASIAAKTLPAFGLNITQTGCLLEVNGTVIAIAEACNGMRMLFGIMLVVYAIAFALPISRGLRIGMLLLSPVVAIVMNFFRILTTVVMFVFFEESTAQAFHDISSWLIPLVIMVGAVLCMERAGGRIFVKPSQVQLPHVNSISRRVATGLGTAILILNTASHGKEIISPEAVDLHHNNVVQCIRNIPFCIGDWLATEESLHQQEEDLLKPIVAFRRTYQSLDASQPLSVVVVASQHARDLVGHEPGICMVRQGWNLISQKDICWQCSTTTVCGVNYLFQDAQNPAFLKQVASILIIPAGPTSGNPASVAAVASDYRRGAFGAASIQIANDQLMDEAEWHRMTFEFVNCMAPLVHQYQTCLDDKQ